MRNPVANKRTMKGSLRALIIIGVMLSMIGIMAFTLISDNRKTASESPLPT